MNRNYDKFGSNNYLKKYIVKPISHKLCGIIHPNFITFFGSLLIIPIIWSLINPSFSILSFVLLLFIKNSLLIYFFFF